MIWSRESVKGAKHWNFASKLKGNFAPLALGAPFFAAAIFQAVHTHRLLGWPVFWLVLSVALPALSLNWLAMTGNRSLQVDFYALHSREFFKDGCECWFAGFAWKEFSSLLDPHQDIGYFVIDGERIQFFGEMFRLSAPVSSIHRLTRKSNPHTLLGLGGFLEIQFEKDGKSDSWLIEIREKRSLLANKRAGAEVRNRLEGLTKKCPRETNPDGGDARGNP